MGKQNLSCWKGIVLTLSCLMLPIIAFCQGNFTNLNFESAVIPPGTQRLDQIPIAQAIPGWQSGFTSAFYDGQSLGGTILSIEDGLSLYAPPPLIGAYSVLLNTAYLHNGVSDGSPASIYQTGLVPTGTTSLRFAALSYGFPFSILLGGQTLNLVPLNVKTGYTIYGADVSAFAGQVETLRIELPAATDPYNAPSFLEIDNFAFSPTPVPEPSALVLLLCFGVPLFLIRRLTPGT